MEIVAPGRFGQALRVSHDADFWVEAAFNREYMVLPLTVECWIKLNSKQRKNVILADGYSIVAAYNIVTNHWSLYSVPETGELAAGLQCMKPSEAKSNKDVADGQWHYIAMVYESNKISLYVDAERVVCEELTQEPKTPVLASDRSNEGPLYFGCSPPDGLTCDGLIDEVRISRVARKIERIPGKPLQPDSATIGLWNFDEIDHAANVKDLSKTNNPARIKQYLPSLDENDRREFGVSISPFTRPMKEVGWQAVKPTEISEGSTAGAEEILLNGPWDCIWVEPFGRSEQLMLEDDAQWKESLTAQVPCSVQTALLEHGKIEDPMVLMNNLNITWVTEKEWWLRKKFKVPAHWNDKKTSLLFEGVDYRATFWLNGYRLGQHEGMFGGPDYDITSLIKHNEQENTLVVCLDPAPINYEDTLKNNVAYGWHYVKLVTLGIWRPVRLQMRGNTALDHPFLRTSEIQADVVHTELSVDCWHWGTEEENLMLEVRLTPKNFTGKAFSFKNPIRVKPGMNHFGVSGKLEHAQLWWPIGMGEPYLYQFECVLKKGNEVVDRYRSHWGARTVEMRPNSDGPNPRLYNWQFVINGRMIWVKGANWCYPDALLRLDRKRIARFIELARNSHIHLLRVWGGGPVENDNFYDVCDETGMMVQQEFSMLGFHQLQNIPSIHATDITHCMVRRLRNRPSLVMWAGANEISGRGRIVDVLGRRCLELDGSRPYHRSCPFGGDVHWYGTYWGDQSLLDYRQVANGRLQGWSPGIESQLADGPIAFTEWGLSSPANHETWKRILPPEEWEKWPPARDAVFVHHTPTWDYAHIEKMTNYAKDFLNPSSLPELIKGMQLAQGLGFKFLAESMRARKPQTTATYFYKLTENYPACSWASIDYYGVPKRSHFYVREAYNPIHVLALFDEWTSKGNALTASVHAVNDTPSPVDAKLEITLFDGQFNVIETEKLNVTIPIDRAVKITDKTYSLRSATPRPLFLCIDLTDVHGSVERNWYFFDFVKEQGCLFNRPKTALEAELRKERGEWCVAVRNVGTRPAVSVELHPGEASNTYYFEDVGFWLNPGEERVVRLYKTAAVDGETRPLKKITMSAWNVQPSEITAGVDLVV